MLGEVLNALPAAGWKQRVKRQNAHWFLSSQAQLLSAHTLLELNLPKVLVFGCSPNPPGVPGAGAGARLGPLGAWTG